MASKTRESSLWSWLKGAERAIGPDLRMERVENAVSSGTPDVDGVLMGRHFKAELKTVARPARESTGLHIKFQPAQPDWIRSWSSAGGRVFVLVQVGSGAMARRYLVPGRNIDVLEDPELTECTLANISLTGYRRRPEELIRIMAGYDTTGIGRTDLS